MGSPTQCGGETIHVLEARAQIQGAIGCEKWYRERCVTLLNKMACTLALSRARARSFRLLLLIRRSCAIGLACNCKHYFRWIPSEGNLADAPSPVYDFGKFKTKSEVPFHYQNFIVSTDQTTHDEIIHPAFSVHEHCLAL